MAYILDEMGLELVKLAHDFAEKEIKPNAAHWDREGIFPLEACKKAMDMGLHCLEIPEEYGGSGVDYVTVAAILEELGKYDAGFATTIAASCLGLKSVMLAGTPEQIKFFAGRVVSGGFGAFALTEAGAGSDAGACRTTAVRDGDEYILNGTKCFITNGGYADTFVVYANTDPAKGLKGLSAFLVERDRPGFSVGKDEDKMGIRSSSTTDLILEDVRIPASHLLGREGQGFAIAMKTLDLARPFVGAIATGIAQRALDEAAAYAKTRVCFGKPIAKLEAIQFMLADMDIKIETARQMVAHALTLAIQKKPFSREAAISKCYAGDIANAVTDDAIQIMGGYGYSREYPVEKLHRDAKIFQIFEGTNQIQRVVISGQLLSKY